MGICHLKPHLMMILRHPIWNKIKESFGTAKQQKHGNQVPNHRRKLSIAQWLTNGGATMKKYIRQAHQIVTIHKILTQLNRLFIIARKMTALAAQAYRDVPPINANWTQLKLRITLLTQDQKWKQLWN